MPDVINLRASTQRCGRKTSPEATEPSTGQAARVAENSVLAFPDQNASGGFWSGDYVLCGGGRDREAVAFKRKETD